MPRTCPLLVVAMVALMTAPAGAQSSAGSQTARAYRGLFGPAERDEAHPPRLNSQLSVYTGYDNTSRFTGGDVLDESLQAGRLHHGTTATLGWLRQRSRSTVAVTGVSTFRYYPTLHHVTTQQHSAAVGVERLASPRLRFRLAQSATYSPWYQLALGQPLSQPEASPVGEPVGMDFSVSRDKHISYATFAGATYTWGPRAEFTTGYNLGYTDFFSRPDFQTQQAAARYTLRLSPDIALRLGYGLGSSSLSGAAPSVHHDLDIGVNYGRSFTFTPRTTLGFTTGSTVISTDSQQHFTLIGSARLQRRLSPLWTSSVTFDRALQAIDSLPRPFVADTVSGELSGYFSARASLRVRPSYAQGVDVADPGRTFYSATNQTRLDFALTRHWALYAEHFYYRYDFSRSPGLPLVLAAGFARQGLRWGLALWAPLVR